jgi:hypothetical protein
MLDPWIIEQIRRREEDERRRRHERPSVEINDYPSSRRDRDRYEEDREPPPSDRGVVIIDFGF